jgi:spore germination cell wall hydrolase CwlJ-like protein
MMILTKPKVWLFLLCLFLYGVFTSDNNKILDEICDEYEIDMRVQDSIKHVKLLSKLINSESGTEDLLDKLMVGSVVLNRMRVSNKTMEEVIYKPNMFSGINTEGFVETKSSTKVAVFLLQNGPIDTSAMHFLNPDKSTNLGWMRVVMQRELVLKNDNHYFYK